MSPRFLPVFCLAIGLTVTPRLKAEEASPSNPEGEAARASANPEASAGSTKTEPTEAAKQEAAERFQRGLSFYEDGDYGLALIEFERAYELVPDYRVLYNIGQVSIQLSRSSQALRALRRYLEEGGEALSQDRIEAVQRDVEMLNARTAHLVLTGTDGAEVLIDDESYGKLPLDGPLLLDAGRRKVELKKEGFRSYNERVTLAGAEERRLVVELEKNPVEAPVTGPVAPPAKEPSEPVETPKAAKRSSPLPLIGWTATGVLAGGAIVSGVLGLSASNKLKDLKDAPDPSRSELDKQAQAARTWFLAADILTASALAAGGLSLYFSLSGKSTDEPATSRDESPRDAQLGLRVAPTALSVSGQF